MFGSREATTMCAVSIVEGTLGTEPLEIFSLRSGSYIFITSAWVTGRSSTAVDTVEVFDPRIEGPFWQGRGHIVLTNVEGHGGKRRMSVGLGA